MPKPPPASSPFWKLFNGMGRLNVVAFRLSGGRVGGAMGAATETEVELARGERRRVRPRVASETEHEQLWPRMVAIYKPYADYQTYTKRKIPIVVPEPA